MSYETALNLFIIFSITAVIWVVALLIIMKRRARMEWFELEAMLDARKKR